MGVTSGAGGQQTQRSLCRYVYGAYDHERSGKAIQDFTVYVELASHERQTIMFVIGIDFSLRKTGFVIVEDRAGKVEVVHRECIKTTDKQSDEYAVAYVVNTIIQKLVDSKYTSDNAVVVVEDYTHGQRNGKSFTRSEIAGAVKYLISTTLSLPLYRVSPSALKSFMTHGKASKDEMGAAAASKYGFFDDDDNIVDAYCCTRYYLLNRAGQRLTIVFVPPYPAMKLLQVPAKLEVARVPVRPLTKKLQPRILKIAQRNR